MTGNRSGARLWLLSFIGFWLLTAGWAFAAPYNGPPDEQQHAMRAAAVADGDIMYQPGDLYPRTLDRGGPSCFPMRGNMSADCVAEPEGDETWVRGATSAGRYNPVYYAVTSWPTGVWPNWRGIMLSRLLTGAAIAALLASTVVAASRWTKHRGMVAGVVVAVTPMVAHLGGSINPNGVEIAAGAALFASLLALVHDQRDGVNRAAVALAGISASVLVTPRFSGVMWLAVILAAILIPSSWARVKELFRTRSVRIWSVVVVLSVIASAWWTLYTSAAEVAQGDNGWTTKQIVKAAVIDIWPNLANQMVGVMGWAEVLMPRLVYVVWFGAIGLLLIGALAVGKRADRWRLTLLFVGTFAPLLLAEMYLADRIGWFNQGRYFLPGAICLPLLGAYLMSRRGLAPEHMRSMTRILAGLLLPIHLVCLAFTMPRWQSGFRNLNPFKGDWIPPYGTVLPLACGLAAVIVLFVVYWQASKLPVEAPVAEDSDTIKTPRPAETVSV